MKNSKWEVVEVKTERVIDWSAVVLLVVKAVLVVAIVVGLFAALTYGIDKQSEFDANVLNSHLSASQRADVVARMNK